MKCQVTHGINVENPLKIHREFIEANLLTRVCYFEWKRCPVEFLRLSWECPHSYLLSPSPSPGHLLFFLFLLPYSTTRTHVWRVLKKRIWTQSPDIQTTGPREKHKATLDENIIETCEGQVIAGAAHCSQSCRVTPAFRLILQNIVSFLCRPLPDRHILVSWGRFVTALLCKSFVVIIRQRLNR